MTAQPAFDGEAQVLRALQELEVRVTRGINDVEVRFMAALTSGLAGVTQSIAQLADTHHRTTLEQERRNASFAERARVDELTTQFHAVAVQAARIDQHAADLEYLKSQYEKLQETTTNRSLGFAQSSIGYIVMFVVMLTSNGIVFVLAHLAGH